MKILRESLLNEDDWQQSNDESQMVKIQLKSIQEDVEELLQKIKDGDQFDAWVQAKIAVAEHSLSAVRDYVILGGEDEEVGGPEIITDLPPMDVAPEQPVPVETPVDAEDELDMGDLVGPGPEVAGEEGDIEELPGAMEPAEDIPLDLDDEEEMEEMVEYGEDHPLQGWQEDEADRRWERDNAGMYDPDEEEYPYDEDDYMMESLDSFLVEKDFSEKKREKLAKSGAAMKDGSYPIESKQDLKNAIKAYGRAKNKAATKRHIMSRARSLGATDLIPEDWK